MNEQTEVIELAQAISQAARGLQGAARALVDVTGSNAANVCLWLLHEVTHRASDLANELAQGYVTAGDVSVDATCAVIAAIDVVAQALKDMAWVATRLSDDVSYTQFANALEYTSKRAEELEQWLHHNAAKSFEDK